MVDSAYTDCNYESAIEIGSSLLAQGNLSPPGKRRLLIRMAAAKHALGQISDAQRFIQEALNIARDPGITTDEYPPSFVRLWDAQSN